MYYFNLISPILYTVFLQLLIPRRNERKVVFFAVIVLQLIIVAAARSFEVGADTLNYKQYYESINKTTVFEYFSLYKMEPLYIVYNKALQFISSNPRLLLVANALFIYPIIAKTFYKYSPIPWLSFFLFLALGFFNTSLNISRQWLAMSIVMSSYPYLINRQPHKFIIRVLIASLFHYTAILSLISYPLLKYKVSLRFLVTMLSLAAVFSIILLPTVLNYALRGNYSIYDFSAEGGFGMFGMLLITTIGGLILKPKIINKHESLFYTMMIMACALQVISLSFSIFFRVVLYWQFAITLFIPMIVARQKSQVSKGVLTFCIIVLATLYYFLIVTVPTDPQGTVPYAIG